MTWRALSISPYFLGGDHTSIPWADAGAQLHEQESLVASMLEGLDMTPDVGRGTWDMGLDMAPDGPEFTTGPEFSVDTARSSVLSSSVGRMSTGSNGFGGGGLVDDFDATSTTSSANGAAANGLTKSAPPGFGGMAGGLWSSGGSGAGSFALWGNGEPSPTYDPNRSSLW